MTVEDEVAALVRAAEAIRARLLEERTVLRVRIDAIDEQLRRLQRVPAVSPKVLPGEEREERVVRRELIASEIGRAGQPLNAQDVIHATAVYFDLSVAQLTGMLRYGSISHARHVAMYLARKWTRGSYPELGMRFGGKDHTTVIAACRKIEVLLVTDAELARDVKAIERALRDAQALREVPQAAV